MIEVIGVMTGRLRALLARGLFASLGFLLVAAVFDPSVAAARSHGYAHAARYAHSWSLARPRAARYAHARYAHARYAHARAVSRYARSQVAFRYARPKAAPASSVIAEASRYIGSGNVTGMRGPWCADYASMVLRRSGHRPLAGRSVGAALAYGPRVRQPKPGDLVVLGRHVGFFAGWDGGRVVMVSGNWGHRVSRASISRGSVVAFIGV